jgi:bifunctional non-homologous end joining protein LigD
MLGRRLHYVGLVGSGLSQDLIRQLTEVFSRTARDSSPFAEKLVGDLHYVEPLLVAEVAYSEITEGGTLRQPSLQGFRTDLDANQVLADEDLQAILDRRPPQVRIRQTW